MRPLGRRPSLRPWAGAVLASLLLSGCAGEAATTQGAKINSMYSVVLAIAVVIWVGVVAAILWAVVRYRKRPDDDGTLPPQIHGNTAFEVVWTIVPTVIVLILFGMSYSTLHAIDKESPTSELGAIIEARGFQWDWEFDYGDGIVVRRDPNKPGSVPEMVVPIGAPIRVELRSDNVIHALYVPEFLFKRDVVPGHANAFEFTVDVPGRYRGQCAELCGTGHAAMTFEVRAVGREVFDKWLVEAKAASAAKPCDAPPVDAITLKTPTKDLTFDQPCVTAKAGAPTKVTYSNGSGLQHNVAVYTKDPSQGGTLLAQTKVIQSGSDSVTVPAQQPGNYYFFCIVHPIQMNGSYTVK